MYTKPEFDCTKTKKKQKYFNILPVVHSAERSNLQVSLRVTRNNWNGYHIVLSEK